MPHHEVPEGMVKLAPALVETAQLRSWFYALEKLPKALRNKSFSEMAAKMRAAGEDTDLTEAVAALSRPNVYKTILEAVRERVGDATSTITPLVPKVSLGTHLSWKLCFPILFQHAQPLPHQ